MGGYSTPSVLSFIQSFFLSFIQSFFHFSFFSFLLPFFLSFFLYLFRAKAEIFICSLTQSLLEGTARARLAGVAFCSFFISFFSFLFFICIFILSKIRKYFCLLTQTLFFSFVFFSFLRETFLIIIIIKWNSL